MRAGDKEIEEKMKQGYVAMSEEHLRNAEFFIAAQSEVVLRGD